MSTLQRLSPSVAGLQLAFFVVIFFADETHSSPMVHFHPGLEDLMRLLGGGCGPGEVQCPHSGRCIDGAWRCDGYDDCGDGSDERDCGRTSHLPGCSHHEFSCTNGNCVRAAFRCDGDNDCGDGSDERNCAACHGDEFRCENTHRCVRRSWRCDGDDDCGDGSDERNCTSGCRHGGFRCSSSGRCISEAWRCDGDVDCNDGSDERNCGVSVGTYVETECSGSCRVTL